MAKRRIECSDAFFNEVGSWLNGAQMSVCPKAADYRQINGAVVSSFRAEISIVFLPSKLKKNAPIVFCAEPWIRRELDWHCFRAPGPRDVWAARDRLCWIHPAEWRLAHDDQLKRLSTVIEEGSNWLRNNVTKLLERHWLGYEMGMKKWRSAWGGWGHGMTGTKELLAELRSNGHPVNWERI